MTRAAALALAAGCATGSRPADAPDLFAVPDHRLDGCAFDDLYRAYVTRFVAADGRVVDFSGGGRTTSEGQAYGLMHALVAQDRPLFDRLLRFADERLAGGKLGERLPAWLFAQGRVADENSASDADLWMAYALLEGARLFGEPSYGRRGRALLRTIFAREVRDGILLPGASGFVLGDTIRVNPSYLVLPQLRRFVAEDARWGAVLESSVRILEGAGDPAPDWIALRGGALVADPIHGAVSSYDAIRVPLWAGLIPRGDPLRARLQQAASARVLLAQQDRFPERIGGSAPSDRAGPPGFRAALVPLARALGESDLASRLRVLPELTGYYDANLALFALAFDDGRARFELDGKLSVTPCAR
jgi:endo-1,4-beta-D-glucanase Y